MDLNRAPDLCQASKIGCWWLLVGALVGSLLLAAPHGASASKFEREMTDKDVLDKLISNSTYDTRVRPPSPDASLVNVSVLLLSLSSPDESSLKYEVEFLLHLFWMDTRLAHNETTGHKYLNGIHHQQHVWLPDIYFLKHGDFKHPTEPVHIALRIYGNGTIHYTARKHLVLSCEGDGDVFPFDDPLCIFSIESISYERDEMIFKWVNDTETQGTTLKKSKRLTTLNAYMVSNRTSECEEQLTWRGNYSCLMVELVFTRDKSFYLSTVFIPGIILVTSSFITFWLEWSAAPARVVIGVTTLLTFFTTSNGFRTSLPVVARLGAMNVWDAVCMFFIYASLLEFVLVNYVGRKKPKGNAVYTPGENAVIQRIPAVIQRIGMTLVSPLSQTTPFMTSEQQMSHRNKQAQQERNKEKGMESVPLNCAKCGATPCPHVVSPTEDAEDQNAMMSPERPPRSRQSLHSSAGGSQYGGNKRPDSTSSAQFRVESEMGHIATSDEEAVRPTNPAMIVSDIEDAVSAAEQGRVSAEQSQAVTKAPPIHPIRIAKTIDVISRVTFPTAFSCFLIFFFARYAWFAYMWNER